MMSHSLWVLLSLAALVAADEASDPEGLLEQLPDASTINSEYLVYVGKWTECGPMKDEHKKSIESRYDLRPESESLVHTPRLGLQRRQVQCQNKDGKFVENMYCGSDVATFDTIRVCVIKENCLLGEWLPWRPRSDGALVRTRRLRRLPQGGGKECDVVEEVRPAALEASAHWVPGPWGSCKVAVEQAATAIPDGGSELRRRRAAARGHVRAHRRTPAAPRAVRARTHADVGAALRGYSVRRRRVISAASGGGAPCPPLEEKRTCTMPRCASWKALPWGPCVLSQPHSTCGPGRRSRELRCVGHDGKEAQRAWCSGSGAPSRTERCRIACPGDCVVSAWAAWSPCAAPCSAPAHPRPSRTRRRHILAHASPDGWPCPSEDQLVQNESCNTHACATYSWLATPWGPCERRRQDYIPITNYTDLSDGEALNESDDEEPCVEEGEMTRDVMCVQNNADVVREALCAPLHRPVARRACTVRCRRGCRVEAWMPWTLCPNTCDPGKQMRVRTVHGGPNCGARQESRPCPTARSCRPRDAAWAAGAWAACRLPPAARCGPGYTLRSIWCGSATHRVEAGACAGQPVPPAVAPCRVPCDADAPLDCRLLCADPLRYLDAADPNIPSCVCKNVTLELLPADSDCILPTGLECGEGRSLRAARCMVDGRDVPMDVCKKYHPLTGANRVREASTDGYTYDEEFPSLLRGACSVRCARDCAAGAWGEWGPCAAEPGSRAAFRFRTRCIDSNGKWVSDAECESSGAGPAPAREAACRAPCPADCVVSAWSEWSPCESTKWGGRRDRTRVVLRDAMEGGAACPHLVAAEPCAAHAYSWHIAPWDDCQPLGGSPCGEGTKRRAVKCLRSDGVFVNDSFCSNTTASEARESWCYVPCGVDCEVGAWGPWDASACSCGDPAPAHMRRTRWVARHLHTALVFRGVLYYEVGAWGPRTPLLQQPCKTHMPRTKRITCSVYTMLVLRPCGSTAKWALEPSCVLLGRLSTAHMRSIRCSTCDLHKVLGLLAVPRYCDVCV
ncbi:hypothetical protein ACJJTC_003907 [Scirpophaga incertulas]